MPLLCGSASPRSSLPAGSAKDPDSGRLGYSFEIALLAVREDQARGGSECGLRQREELMRQGCWAAGAREGHVDAAPYSKNMQVRLWVLLCVCFKAHLSRHLC